MSWSAFEHISDPVNMCREVLRILRPGGLLFLQLWPFYYSDRGSHLWEWYPAPFHHLTDRDDDVVAGMRSSSLHSPDHTQNMVEEFRSLNRLTLEGLHRSLLAGGLRVARLELMTGTINIPQELACHQLADLAVSGVKLVAVPVG